MQQPSINAKHLAFLQYPKLLEMGLATLPPAHWIEADNNLEFYQQNKLRQANNPKATVYAELEQSYPAQEELSALLLDHLIVDHSDLYQIKPAKTAASQSSSQVLQYLPAGLQWSLDKDKPHSLWNSSLWIQDDICLLQKQRNTYYLTAASLCAPSHWRLEEKIGKDFFAIHQPVPGFKNKFELSINRFLNKLSFEQAVTRCNWSVTQHNALMQLPEQLTAAQQSINETSELFLRIERQSLRKLPQTQAIVFTIKVYNYPLEQLVSIDGAVQALANSIKGLSPQEYQYKAMERLEAPLKAFFNQYNKP